MKTTIVTVLLSIVLTSCIKVEPFKPLSKETISPYTVAVDGDDKVPTVLKLKEGCTTIYLIGVNRASKGYYVSNATGYVVSDIDCYRGVDR
jgi:hypothetical protein